MNLVRRQPKEVHKTVAFVSIDGECGQQEIDQEIFGPDEFCDSFSRVKNGYALTLRECADALDVGVVVVSSILRGAVTFATKDDLQEAIEKLAAKFADRGRRA